MWELDLSAGRHGTRTAEAARFGKILHVPQRRSCHCRVHRVCPGVPVWHAPHWAKQGLRSKCGNLQTELPRKVPFACAAVQMKSVCARARNSYSKEQLRKDFR